MTARLRRSAVALGGAALAFTPEAPGAQELAGPAVAWRSRPVPATPTVTWTIAGREGQVSSVRFEARALFERMMTELAMYRVILPLRSEYAGASVLTVEKLETIAVAAGRFETIVLRVESEAMPGTPPGHRVYRRYWYEPALGWYLRHELVMTGPSINQRNLYEAAKIAPAERRTERK